MFQIVKILTTTFVKQTSNWMKKFLFLIIKTTMKQFIYLNPLYLYYLHLHSDRVCDCVRVFAHIFICCMLALLLFFLVYQTSVSTLNISFIIYLHNTWAPIHALFLFNIYFFWICDNQLGNIYFYNKAYKHFNITTFLLQSLQIREW